MKKFSNYKKLRTTSLSFFLVAIIGLTASISSAPYAAEKGYTNYISDSLEVPMRRGAGYKYKISRMLKSGEPVKILEVNKSGWAQVQYKKSGKTYIGWMPTVLLQNQPVAKERLSAQIKKTTEVEEKFNALQKELDTLKSRHTETDSELSATKQENFELGKELDRLKMISTNAVELDEQNQEMKIRLTQLENQNAIMKEQIDEASDSVKRQWFLTGGGVLLLGLMIGLFFRSPGKRKKWGEL